MYKSLQAGRAFAAMMVVLFHLGGAMALEKYFGIVGFSIPFSFGFSGVEFFFVLSGFIIIKAHKSHFFRPGEFLEYARKRVIRIYPVYWIIFLGVYFTALLIPSLKNSVPQDFQAVVEALILLPQDKSVVGGTGAAVLIVAWSLQYEMVFYLFTGLLFLKKLLSYSLIAISAVVFSLYFLDLIPYFPLSYLSIEYISLFMMGAFVANYYVKEYFTMKLSKLLLGSGFLIVCALSIDVITQLNFAENNRIVLFGFGYTLIVVGLISLEDFRVIIGGNPFFQLVGGASYALYLIHFPLISIMLKIAMGLGLKELGMAGAVISFIVIFISCIVASILFHLYIEIPMMRKLAQYKFKRPIVESSI